MRVHLGGGDRHGRGSVERGVSQLTTRNSRCAEETKESGIGGQCLLAHKSPPSMPPTTPRMSVPICVLLISRCVKSLTVCDPPTHKYLAIPPPRKIVSVHLRGSWGGGIACLRGRWREGGGAVSEREGGGVGGRPGCLRDGGGLPPSHAEAADCAPRRLKHPEVHPQVRPRAPVCGGIGG